MSLALALRAGTPACDSPRTAAIWAGGGGFRTRWGRTNRVASAGSCSVAPHGQMGPCGLGILCVLVLLGVAERAHPARQLWQQERVVAVNVEMVAHERGEARDVVVEDGVTLGA